MAQLDLANLAPEKATWQTSTNDNPAAAWLRESFEAKEARQVNVPASQARAVVNMLNGACRITGLGVSIRVVVGKEEFTTSTELWEQVEKLKDRVVTVKFRGKVKTNRPRKNSGGTADETSVEPDSAE